MSLGFQIWAGWKWVKGDSSFKESTSLYRIFVVNIWIWNLKPVLQLFQGIDKNVDYNLQLVHSVLGEI
jgi:hypothetical protein